MTEKMKALIRKYEHSPTNSAQKVKLHEGDRLVLPEACAA